jgi:hypothetical protein
VIVEYNSRRKFDPSRVKGDEYEVKRYEYEARSGNREMVKHING